MAELFATNRERLAQMVRFRIDRRLHGRMDPDDVLQEAFLESRQRLKHYRPDSPMTPFIWLRHVVLQTLTDAHRRHLGAQRRDAGREAGAAAASPKTSVCLVARLIAHSTSPSGAAMRDEMSRRLFAAVDSMDEIDREVLALRHFEELTNTETAEALGIEVKAASIRYFRALKRLKDLLAETGLLDDYLQSSRHGR